MADPILKVTYAGAQTPYAILRRDSDGTVWNGSTFTTWTNANLGSYALTLTNRGGDLFTASLPSVAAGTYTATYYESVSNSYSVTDLALLGSTLYVGGASSTGSSGPYLTTLNHIKTYLGIDTSVTTYDAKLTQMMILASNAVHNYCDRTSFLSANYTERYDGNGIGLNGGYVSLRNVPVTALTSVTLDPGTSYSDTYAGSLFTYDSNKGFLFWNRDSNQRRAFPMGFRNVEVVYTAGYSSVPEDLDLATAIVASALYQQSETNPAVKSEKLGDYSYTNGRESGSPWSTVFQDAAPILAKYKRVGAL
jgi:hypothetical protein